MKVGTNGGEVRVISVVLDISFLRLGERSIIHCPGRTKGLRDRFWRDRVISVGVWAGIEKARKFFGEVWPVFAMGVHR